MIYFLVCVCFSDIFTREYFNTTMLPPEIYRAIGQENSEVCSPN